MTIPLTGCELAESPCSSKLVTTYFNDHMIANGFYSIILVGLKKKKPYINEHYAPKRMIYT